jgi:short-subunit dehydrogenase
MEKQIILITGATTGIGRHTALHLARQGHRVIATGRNAAALAELAREAADTALVTLKLDVTDAGSIEAARAAVGSMTSGYGVDVLVNNAGYGAAAPLVESPDAEVRSQFETNVFGLLAVTRAFAPAMMDRRSGRIINVSSVGGRIAFPLFGAYNGTKFAVESMSDALRNELRPFGVKVSVIEPGPIHTEFSNRSVADVARYQDAGSRYAKVFARAEALKQQADRMSVSPQVIVRAIEKAATARRPAARYVAPFSSLVGLVLMKLMPTALLDAIMSAASGLTPRGMGLAAAPARTSIRPARLEAARA